MRKFYLERVTEIVKNRVNDGAVRTLRDQLEEKENAVQRLRSELDSALSMHQELQREFKLELQQLNLKNEALTQQLRTKEMELAVKSTATAPSRDSPALGAKQNSDTYSAFDLNLEIKKLQFDKE